MGVPVKECAILKITSRSTHPSYFRRLTRGGCRGDWDSRRRRRCQFGWVGRYMLNRAGFGNHDVQPLSEGLFVRRGDPSNPIEEANFLLLPTLDFSIYSVTIFLILVKLIFLLMSSWSARVNGGMTTVKGIFTR